MHVVKTESLSSILNCLFGQFRLFSVDIMVWCFVVLLKCQIHQLLAAFEEDDPCSLCDVKVRLVKWQLISPRSRPSSTHTGGPQGSDIISSNDSMMFDDSQPILYVPSACDLFESYLNIVLNGIELWYKNG